MKDFKSIPELNKLKNTNSLTNLDIKENKTENLAKELDIIQNEYFDLLKVLLYFMHKDKNKEINDSIKNELSESGKKMAIYLETSFVNKGTIKKDDRIFKT